MNRKKIIIENSISESPALAEFLITYISENKIPTETLDDLRLVTEETFINITRYAHPSDVICDVEIEIEHTEEKIDITFTDSGYEFNPLADNTKVMDTEDYCDGGMGIHIIKSLTDEQQYKRVEQHNVFTVTKHYTK